MSEPRVKHMPKSAWKLMPPPEGACEECGYKHDPEQPHNPQSLWWATKREIEGGPAPTWEEALKHCSPGVRAHWIEGLAKRGVEVGEID